MPIKRTRAKVRKPTLPTNLIPMAERLLELSEVHMAAIQGGDQSFYDDGRHEELVTILPTINAALDIKLWFGREECDDTIRDAIAAAKARSQ